MRTCFGQNRLVSQTDRRFHATDIELAGGYVQVVPAVAARMTPQVRVGAWSFTETTLHQAEQIEAQRGRTDEVRNLREQRWWARQWRQRNGLYRVRELSPAEDALARRLLGRDGIPPECFPRAEGTLVDDNDAQIIAQVIAGGGTLLLTSNMVMVRDGMLQEWFDRHHNEWPGVQARQLVQRVDELFCRWWQHRRGPEVLTRTALAAFWPEDASASPELVRIHAEEGLEAMARGHFPRFAPQVREHIQLAHDVAGQIEAVRRNLPHRTRQAEAERRAMIETHPSFGHEAAERPVAEHESGRYHW